MFISLVRSPLSMSIASETSQILCKLLILCLLSILLVTLIVFDISLISKTASLDLQKEIKTSLIPNSFIKLEAIKIFLKVKSGKEIFLFKISTPLLFPIFPEEIHLHSI